MTWLNHILRIGVTCCVMICSPFHGSQAFPQHYTLRNSGYTVYYNSRTCLAEYVEWTITPTQLGGFSRTDAGSFRIDRRVPRPRAKSSHYTNSGFHRGHLCPAADWSASTLMMRETFLLTNVVPMRPRVNMVGWKATESRCRMLAIQYNGVRVRVWTFIETADTLYLRNSPIAVPTSFAKQVSTLDGDSLLCEWRYVNQ